MIEVLATLAVCYVVITLVDSDVAEPLRIRVKKYSAVLSCFFCTSLWISVAACSLYSSEIPYLLRVPGVAMAASILVAVYYNLLGEEDVE